MYLASSEGSYFCRHEEDFAFPAFVGLGLGGFTFLDPTKLVLRPSLEPGQKIWDCDFGRSGILRIHIAVRASRVL